MIIEIRLVALERLLDAREKRDRNFDARGRLIGRQLSHEPEDGRRGENAVEHDLERRLPSRAHLDAERLELALGGEQFAALLEHALAGGREA